MRILMAAAAAAGLFIVAAQAREGGEAVPVAAAASAPVVAAAATPNQDWSAWTRPLGAAAAGQAAAPASADPVAAPVADDEIDVVDAHWMALTMWGEARGQGEEGMRAVGHVIRNRWLAKRHGAYVTDTVSAAWQFSCWNQGDPNRQAMLNIEDLPKGSAGYRQWLQAKRLAADILAGRSADPTGGALFYHTIAVHPKWSQGVAPIAQIGTHLFFRTVR